MATKTSEMLHRYAAYVKQRCPGASSAEILWFLNEVSKKTNAELVAPCSANGAQLCHIVEYLSVCNVYLRLINVELKEVEPGEFGFFLLEAPFGGWKGRLHIRGWILLHWLLQEHRCIKTLMLPWTTNPEDQGLLSDALHLNCGLNKLTLRWPNMTTVWDSQEIQRFYIIMPAIGTLAHLEELNMGHACLPSRALGDLRDALLEISALHTLMLPSIVPCFRNTDDVVKLVQGLKRLPKITVLSSDDYVLKAESGVVFAEFVAESNSLKKLFLCRSVCYDEIDVLFTAVGQNNALEELHLKGFILSEDSEQLLAKVVAQHTGLRYLEVDNHDVLMGGRTKGVALAELVGCNTGLRELVLVGTNVEYLPAFAEAVRKNTTMKKLTLGLPFMDAPNYSVFLQALACNQSLELVTFKDDIDLQLWFEGVPELHFNDIVLLVQETGTEGRLEIDAFIDDPQVFESSLKNSTSLTKVRYFPLGCLTSDSSRPVLPSAFHHLLQHHHLQELNITLDHRIEKESATSLALFLSITSSLRHVALDFRATAALSRILVEGIAGNTSLVSLSIIFWTFNAPETDLLWRTLESSKTLKTLTLLLDFEHSQVLDQVPDGLLNNHYLLKATIQQNPEQCLDRYPNDTLWESREKLIVTSTQMFQFGVQELMRRNLCTLHRAVQFFMGARGRRFAEAFERVSKGSTLNEALKKATGESDEEIKRKVASSMRYLDEHFLAEAGVVRHTVVCGESSRAQLDWIGLDNWLHIRQFLKVTDIILKPGGPSSFELLTDMCCKAFEQRLVFVV